MSRSNREPLFAKGNLWCPGCPLGLIWRKIVEVTGPQAMASIGSTCSGMSAVLHPSPLNIPTIHIGMPGPAAAMTGISVALEILRKKGKRPSDEKITVLAVAGDGGTADIGMASLSGAAERNDDGIYICFDNEAYMNTGIQRSSPLLMDHHHPLGKIPVQEGPGHDHGRPQDTLCGHRNRRIHQGLYGQTQKGP